MDQINRSAAVQDIDSKAALHAPSHPSSALNDAHIKPNVITLEQLDENDQDPPEPESDRQQDADELSFLQRLKEKAQKDQLKVSLAKNENELLINDDEDKFMHRLEK